MERLTELNKKNNKLIFGIIIFSLILCLIFIGGIYAISNDYKSNEIVCGKQPFSVIYLKASEISLASELANKVDIVVIPELNQINARTEILNCPNFDVNKYLIDYRK